MWAVDVKETATFVGQCGLQPVERTGPEVELALQILACSFPLACSSQAARVVELRMAAVQDVNLLARRIEGQLDDPGGDEREVA
jgi:hypothetical protein